jgi:large subunit ribosomal protein L15
MAQGAKEQASQKTGTRGLHSLHPAKGSVRDRRRVGRGPGSGRGKTSGRGEKGQKSRSGASRKLGFEGGQMPLYRRVPKRGFHNPFRVEYACINVGQLEAFEAGTIVTPEVLLERGAVKKLRDGLKILGEGKLSKALTVRAHKFSARAQEVIAAAGGTVEVIERQTGTGA